EHGILKDFLEENSTEVNNMLFTEWNWDDALEVAREEGIDSLCELLEQGYTPQEAREMLKNKSRVIGVEGRDFIRKPLP
ncbi:MAG: hypothetical protein LBV68_01660, partial [Spirochaetaceae bacterium]|nr:hypothetical protein [Spirochaetaceae bacterium]